MRTRASLPLLLPLLLLLPATLAAAQGSGSDALAGAVNAYLEPFVRTGNFSGAVLITRGDHAVFSQAYGMADHRFGVRNTPQTRFHIASVSKPFTAVAILLLEQQGRLSVHDPVERHIPGYPAGDRITLHHLLTHTSGIPNINAAPEYEQWSRFPATPAELVARFQDAPLQFAPGERYSYSNSNYNLLAYIIEIVSGQSYGDFLHANLLQPLGLCDTAHHGRAADLVANSASGYVPAGYEGVENAPFTDWSVKTGNGSLYSTVADLHRFYRALRTDKLLKASARERMFTVQAGSTGYGWFVRQSAGRPVLAANGRSPGFTSSLECFPQHEDVCVIVLANSYSGLTQSLAEDLAVIAFGDERTTPLLASAPPLSDKAAAEFTGNYRFGQDFRFNPGVEAVVEADAGRLRMRLTGQAPSYLLPRAEGGFFDRLYGGTVRFERNQDGRIEALLWGFGTEYRALRR